MKETARYWLSLALTIALLAGCAGDKPTTPAPPAARGKITARATGISAQNGNVYSVEAFAFDWSPGASGPSVAGIRVMITTDPFSSSAVLDSLDSQGSPTSEDKVLDPGTYSVVFFVGAPGSAPSHFAEVRVALDGDKTVDAPPWAQWVHP